LAEADHTQVVGNLPVREEERLTVEIHPTGVQTAGLTGTLYDHPDRPLLDIAEGSGGAELFDLAREHRRQPASEEIAQPIGRRIAFRHFATRGRSILLTQKPWGLWNWLVTMGKNLRRIAIVKFHDWTPPDFVV